MSYYRLKADFDNLFQAERRNRSCSLPREISGYPSDRQSRARSVDPVDRFSHRPAMPFTSRALSVPPLDYLDFSRSRYARNLEPSWYTYYQEPRASYYDYTHDYYRPRSYYYDYHDYLMPSYYEPSHYEPRLTRTPYYGYGHCQESLGYDHPTSYSLSMRDYYGSNKYSDYVHSSSNDVLGRWKHYRRSNNTLNERTQRAASPLVSRELDRYFSNSERLTLLWISSGPRGSPQYVSAINNLPQCRTLLVDVLQ
eukprot:TRINITY_DN2508_c0_g1_i1.p1 TRINITY_DN2508_c0_g1~~TRINITY_DN2508_c0_g1_i1.p1  ORF type:complete len:253 (+),score=14.94 TRINITY_DN2508_c0_g1_i1:115-873(+)